jgi:hypothetical protein
MTQTVDLWLGGKWSGSIYRTKSVDAAAMFRVALEARTHGRTWACRRRGQQAGRHVTRQFSKRYLAGATAVHEPGDAL